jgi:hypothetical protein
MATSYKNRALKMRADTIARSETITALHQAQSDALDQAVHPGLKSDTITMIWRSAHDARVRDAHRALDGQKIKRGGVFQSALGPIRFPGDPSASAANTINCRCFLESRPWTSWRGSSDGQQPQFCRVVDDWAKANRAAPDRGIPRKRPAGGVDRGQWRAGRYRVRPRQHPGIAG